MHMQVSRRLQYTQTPVIPVVGDLIRRTPGTLSLGQGVVHYGPPDAVKEHIDRFWKDPSSHKYKAVQGEPFLLDLIQKKLAQENRLPAGPGTGRTIIVTAGANMAFMNALLAVADPGDELVLLRPYYFNHEMAVTIAGCKPVVVDTDENFLPRPDLIEAAITPRTRAVVTISPNNPTGAVYPEEPLRAINQLCRNYGIHHIHDEAYEYFLYDGARHFSPGSIPEGKETTISIFSLSKAYGFASWRIGYMVAPESLLEPIRKIQDTQLICPPLISQYAAAGALTAGKGYCKEGLQSIATSREIVLRKLGELPSSCVVPYAAGAFYFLVRIDTEQRSMALVERLIREHKVAALPGSTFGLDEPRALRLAYGALKPENAEEAMDRFVRGMKSILHKSRFNHS